MVDLDSDPTKLIDIVEIGKQLLITRGALTTFSVANDVAKYFAILPAMFVVAFPDLDVLNIMRLSSPESAILSAVVFNALIIVALIPLALRGVRYTAVLGRGPAAPQPADLRRRRPGRAVRRHQAARPRHLADPRHLRRWQMKVPLRTCSARAWPGSALLVAATLLLGVAYPLAVYGVGRGRAPWQAHGRWSPRPARTPRTPTRRSARRSSASWSTTPACSSRGRRRPATATTRCRQYGSNSARRART